MIETAAILSAGATLLGSLNKPTPKDSLAVQQLLDEEDPIRRTLDVLISGVPRDTKLTFADSTEAVLLAVLEVGYGAARVRLRKYKNYDFGKQKMSMPDERVSVLRFSAIAAISFHPQSIEDGADALAETSD